MHPSIHAIHTPDKPAFIMAGSGRVVTYRELDDQANRCAQLFRQLGIETGDHIAILMENNAEFMEVCWGAQRSGLIYTAISTHLAADEVAYILQDCDAVLLITSHKLAALADAAANKTPTLRHRMTVGGPLPGFLDFAALRDLQPPRPIADQCAGIDMLYSSGTTGRPKGITVTFDAGDITAMLPALQGLAKMFSFDANSVYLSPAPLYHAAPLRYVMMTMSVGGTVIIMEKFDAQAALDLISRYRVTHSQWVPIMFSRMLALPEAVRKNADVSSMQHAIHAAAPCPVSVKEQMIEWWGPIIDEYYSCTEMVGVTAITSRDWKSHPGSVGKAIIGEPHVVDDESGEELPVGETGTLYFANGPTVSYHKDPKKSAEIRNEKGWQTVGDIGHMDEDGFIYLTDRRAFMIITGGVNVYPQETENALMEHALVADVAVIGVPSAQYGEEVKAVVELRDPRDASATLAQELIDFCRERISHIKCPRSIDFIEALPRYDNGKLYKRKLIDEYRKAAQQ